MLSAVTIGLMVIFISNQLIRFLGMSANGKLAGDVVLMIVALQTPILLALLLPLGLYLGLLIAYGRLYADNEMTILFASGVSRGQLLLISLKMAVWVAILVAIFMLWVNPHIMASRDQIMAEAGKSAIIRNIMPGRFREAPGGRAVFYIKSISRDRDEAKDVFVVRQQKKNAHEEQWEMVSAQSAMQSTDPKTGEAFVVINNGRRYVGNPGEPQFRIEKFKQYKFRIKQDKPAAASRDANGMSTTELFKIAHKNPEAAAELEWRLSLPLSVFLLTLLAVPLSRVNPRQGKFAKLVPAVMIYVVYANMMFVGRAWVEDGKIPIWLGVWWIHLVLLFIVGFIWAADWRIFRVKGV